MYLWICAATLEGQRLKANTILFVFLEKSSPLPLLVKQVSRKINAFLIKQEKMSKVEKEPQEKG